MNTTASPTRPRLRDRLAAKWSACAPMPLRIALDLARPRTAHRGAARLAGCVMRRRVARGWRGQSSRPVILVGMVEHLGDIVACEPIARRLRREQPDAVIAWAVRRPYRELIDNHPAIDVTLPVRCLTQWMELKRGGAFDRVVDLHVHGRLCAKCNAPLVREPGNRAIHIGNYYNHGSLLQIACRVGGLPVLNDAPRLHIPPGVRDRVDALRLPPRFVAIHARSNQVERDWRDECWQRLVSQLNEVDGLAVVEVGLAPVVRSDHRRYVDLCGRLSILETAEVLRRAAAFVGIDSGPAHLANAARTPGVVLLGHYRRYQRYMPYTGCYAKGDRAAVLFADGPAAAHRVSEVREAVHDVLAKAKRAAADVSHGFAAAEPPHDLAVKEGAA